MDGFADLLEEIDTKFGGPLMWVTQKKQFLESETNLKPKRSLEQLKQDVIQSARLRHVIDQLLTKHAKNYNNSLATKPEHSSSHASQKTKTTLPMVDNNSEAVRSYLKVKRDEIEKEAKAILDEMAHDFNLKYVRMLGYVLIKVFKRIYKHVYFNTDMNENLQVIKHFPTILLPLHRSYMDFMIVSIILYHRNIQLPAIATGQDFLGLSYLSKVMRHCGAFFIRRSFGNDELYWAIFQQYVQEHLSNCDRALEFFIEGTRSRTSKSLLPKQGMLATCAELYLKGHRVYDMYFVPISITYERLLEEYLYSNELLGIPKPKESVSGLLKARTILGQSYGSMFVNFARPISLRELLHHMNGPTLNNRLTHTITPGFIFQLDQHQLKLVESASYLLLIDMLRNQILHPISLIASCILLSFKKQTEPNSSTSSQNKFKPERLINLEFLCNQVERLKRILINLGARVFWPSSKSNNQSITNETNISDSEESDDLNKTKQIVLDSLTSHSDLFMLHDSRQTDMKKELTYLSLIEEARKQPIKSSSFYLSIKLSYEADQKSAKVAKSIETSVFESASIFISVCCYRNQLVNFLIRICFVVNSLLASAPTNEVIVDGNTGMLHEARAFEIYKHLSSIFNREFIFKAGDELKDFKDAIGYLINTNLIKLCENSAPTCNSINNNYNRKFSLNKFNLSQFSFFAVMFRSALQNYFEIYSTILSNKSTRDDVVEFDNEKNFTKYIQQCLFNKLVETNPKENCLFDMEVLSLNQLTNALLSLRQYSILLKLKSTYRLDLSKLRLLNERLSFVIKSNITHMRQIKKASKSFDSSISDVSSSTSITNNQFELNDYYETSDDDVENRNDFDLYEKLFQIKNSQAAKL